MLKLDFNRIYFEEINMEDIPYFVWFDYQLSADELAEWIANDVTENEIPKGTELYPEIWLVLTMFSKDDFKLEAQIDDVNGKRYEVMLNESFHNADEFIQLMPDYGKIRF